VTSHAPSRHTLAQSWYSAATWLKSPSTSSRASRSTLSSSFTMRRAAFEFFSPSAACNNGHFCYKKLVFCNVVVFTSLLSFGNVAG